MAKSRKNGIALRTMLIVSGIVIAIILLMQPLVIWEYRDLIAVLFPKGIIGVEQRNLLFIIQAIMLLVIIPVYIFTFIFSWKYSAKNPKGTYDPDLVDSHVAEIFWWGIPLVLTCVIAVLTWVKTYELDPFKPIESDRKPLRIQVVALQWKWLFIYPEDGVASVNFFQFPKDTPLHFEITADAPMNSFWIPHLGGQIYAMPQMKTQLYLIADAFGDFRGCSANISGEGFSHMNFIARCSTDEEYADWLQNAKSATNILNYDQLALPSINEAAIYKLNDPGLFDEIIMKYMHPPK